MNDLNIYKPNTLYNKNNTLFAFDAFIKNDHLILIMPLYNNYPSLYNIHAYVKNGKIALVNDIIKDKYEATRIMIYKIQLKDKEEEYSCVVVYNNRIFTIKNNISEKSPFIKINNLSLTTLCKNDYELIQPFINYYVNSGVDIFYIYYNGLLTNNTCEHIKNICIKNNIPIHKIVFIEWNFDYWNKNSLHSKHHAQLGQLHHAIYFFGKKYGSHMIFCDLDEYLYIKDHSIGDYIKNNPKYDSICFNNIWSKSNNKDILPHEMSCFNNSFQCSRTTCEYGWRSKCIHKLSSIKTISIHKHDCYNKKNFLISKNHMMFHFYSWSQPNRKIESIQKNIEFKNITLL